MSDAKRGFMPQDEKDFNAEGIAKMKVAAQDVLYLLDAGYSTKSATTFVGDHYQLSERQRICLARSISPTQDVISRLNREVTDIRDETLYIDGFNAIICLEVAYASRMSFKCMDGSIRDLAGLMGTYRIMGVTHQAVRAILSTLTIRGVKEAVIYLDKPVSNSGRLKTLIFEIANEMNCPIKLEVILLNAVDAQLKKLPLIASGDSIILNECDKWFNLNKATIDDNFVKYPYLNVCPVNWRLT